MTSGPNENSQKASIMIVLRRTGSPTNRAGRVLSTDVEALHEVFSRIEQNGCIFLVDRAEVFFHLCQRRRRRKDKEKVSPKIITRTAAQPFMFFFFWYTIPHGGRSPPSSTKKRKFRKRTAAVSRRVGRRPV